MSESKASLQSLRNAGSLLFALQESLQQAVVVLEDSLLPFEFGRGLSSIPDEVLSIIFEYVYRCHPPYLRSPPLLWLSLVCRRFRNVISSNPLLWNKITLSSRISTDKVNRFLEKSKAVGLELNLRCTCPSRRPILDGSLHQLSNALLHTARWEFLGVDLTGHNLEDFGQEFGLLCALRLPRLRSLSIVYPFINLIPHKHFYKSCELPMLRCLHIEQEVPEPFTSPILTTFSIRLISNRFAANNLLDFLSATPTLEDIHISLSRTSVHWPGAYKDVVLENVKTFKLTLGSAHLGRLYPFRRAIHTPNVKRIDLEVKWDFWQPQGEDSDDDSEDDEDEWQRGNWKDAFGPDECLKLILCHESYPHLEHFYYGYRRVDAKRYYEIPFQKMPRLRVLELRTTGAFPIMGWQLHMMEPRPPLREIRLYWDSYGERGWEEWLRNIYQLIVNVRPWGAPSDFDSLFINYYDENSGSIHRLFSKQIVWSYQRDRSA